MEKLLKIYTYVDGVNDTPFPNADAQIEIFNFNYNAKRMGGAPTISTSVMYKDCLDKLWTGKEYVIYNGERYKLKQIPTSSKNNADARYKHDLELVALRVVLDYVYFFDAVVDNTPVDDKPVTNSTKVVFSGDIHEFARRLNASLKYTKLDYSVVVDEGITSEIKFLEFTDQPISSVLQEIYKQYEIPYYFVGNVIHIGFTSNAITETFKYGADNALLSISKNNANNKVVNRCTGVGSSENIPYYYPNEHPLGIVDSFYNDSLNNNLATNKVRFAEKVKNATKLTYVKHTIEEDTPSLYLYKKDEYENYEDYGINRGVVDVISGLNHVVRNILNNNEDKWFVAPLVFYKDWFSYDANIENVKHDSFQYLIYYKFNQETTTLSFRAEIRPLGDNALYFRIDRDKYKGCTFDIQFKAGDSRVKYKIYNSYGSKLDSIVVDDMRDDYIIVVLYKIGYTLEELKTERYQSITTTVDIKLKLREPLILYFWENEAGDKVSLQDYGLTYNGTPNVGDEITFQTRAGSLIPFQDTLMPPVYRQSKGAESFYNALNDTYVSPETNEYYSFDNEYSDENRREHKETFEYIKPSIEFVRNGDVLPVNMFLDFAYDKNDNNEIDESTNEYVHPYFYAKLRKFNGDNPFNLFDSANEKGEMTISMTSGDCGACQFVVVVEENTKKNIVQVDDSGNLVYENDRVKFGDAQDRQNDTINNEVWIALKKDSQTFGTILPSKGTKPKACSSVDSTDGDTFVITNISLPTSYIYEAEERLKEEIIKYMKLNNSEKFTFSTKFSRIYLAENPHILSQLNENARIQIEYNGIPYELYISSYQYKVANAEVLPEITVELADTLTQGENAIQKAISAVEHSIISSVGSIDFYKQGLRYFIRKDVEDWARGILHLTKGATFGENDNAKIDEQGNADFISQIIREYISTPQFTDGFAGQGFKLWIDEQGKSNLTIDNLTAREAFRVFELLVTQLRAVNGGLFVSAANGTIKEVVDGGDYYDIILENSNTFIAGDYMRCQVLNGIKQTYYWVEVASVNDNSCRVLKSEFNDATPLAGQEVVLDGSKNKGRQNAIHISASDDGQPRIDILNNITTKSHVGCLRTRLGNLDGIKDEHFTKDGMNIAGDGLYSDNAYLKGDFILKKRGESVDTLFAITDGNIKSVVAQTQTVADSGGYIRNASFEEGLKYWQTSNTYSSILSNGDILFDGKQTVNSKDSVTILSEYDNKFYANIKDGWIKQLNDNFINKPNFESEVSYPVTISFKIRVRTSGVLRYGLGDSWFGSERLGPTNDFVVYKIEGKEWYGTENFRLSFEYGEADVMNIKVYTDDMDVKHRTLFEQTDSLIGFSAQTLNKDGSIKNGSDVQVTPNGTFVNVVKDNEKYTLGEFSIDENGRKKIRISGDNIRLEGNLTVDGNFKVREDGSIETRHALFYGFSKMGTMYVDNESYSSFYKTIANGSFERLEADLSDGAPIVVFEHDVNDNVNIIRLSLPSIDKVATADGKATRAELEYVRGFIGNTILIYNYTNKHFELEYTNDTGDAIIESDFIKSGFFVKMDCKMGIKQTTSSRGVEYIYWEKTLEGNVIQYNE